MLVSVYHFHAIACTHIGNLIRAASCYNAVLLAGVVCASYFESCVVGPGLR